MAVQLRGRRIFGVLAMVVAMLVATRYAQRRPRHRGPSDVLVHSKSVNGGAQYVDCNTNTCGLYEDEKENSNRNHRTDDERISTELYNDPSVPYGMLGATIPASIHRIHGRLPSNLRARHFRGVFVGYRRSRATQYPNQALIQIDGCTSRYNAEFFIGKKVAYIYKGEKKRRGTKYRTIWGKVTRYHGKSGTVRARFRKNLPANAMYQSVKVYRYPLKPDDFKHLFPNGIAPEISTSDHNSTHFAMVVPKGYKPPKKNFFPQLWEPHVLKTVSKSNS
mmetsp:Transcript_14579/g.35565  ORF Transcript_14579/g.35565 Transcript_14579/m.35565 type:complete len:277 (-) Transcript_14579:147-977(-)